MIFLSSDTEITLFPSVLYAADQTYVNKGSKLHLMLYQVDEAAALIV